MTKSISPNSRCSCGSGKKYKNCHGAAAIGGSGSTRKVPAGYIAAAVLVAVILGIAAYSMWQKEQAPGVAPAGKVWSSEHGHWHDAQ